MQEYNIFVSYSRKDAALVECVVSLLRAIGAQAFRDADSIPAGKKWRPVLEEALDNATVMLVFWCIHSESSVEVQAEYQRAIHADKCLIPVILDDTPLCADLSQYQWIDMRPIIGDHRKDSFPIRIDSPGTFRPIHSWVSGTWKPNYKVDDEHRQKVYAEAARRIYESIPDCIR
jgi:hypothetical protein